MIAYIAYARAMGRGYASAVGKSAHRFDVREVTI